MTFISFIPTSFFRFAVLLVVLCKAVQLCARSRVLRCVTRDRESAAYNDRQNTTHSVWTGPELATIPILSCCFPQVIVGLFCLLDSRQSLSFLLVRSLELSRNKRTRGGANKMPVIIRDHDLPSPTVIPSRTLFLHFIVLGQTSFFARNYIAPH